MRGYGHFDGSLAGNSSAGIEIEVGPDAAGGVEGHKVQFLYNAGVIQLVHHHFKIEDTLRLYSLTQVLQVQSQSHKTYRLRD